jgi:hypothetical protein
MYLDLLTNDLNYTTNAFNNINTLEIISNDEVVARYTCFNSYDSISYLGEKYVSRLKQFCPILKVTLAKTNIIDQVARLDAQINNIVDVDNLSLEEYREYILNQVSKSCQEDIFDGMYIELSNGLTEKFSFNLQDQQDLKALFDTAVQFPEFSFSWHSNGKLCRLYPAIDIIKIYSNLQMKLLRCTTYCNTLNILIRAANDRMEISNYYYGYELEQEAQNNINEIVSAMGQIFRYILDSFGIEDDMEQPEDDSSVEDEELIEDENEENDTVDDESNMEESNDSDDDSED